MYPLNSCITCMIPLPFFITTESFEIIEFSERASNNFPTVSHFTDLIEKDSQNYFLEVANSGIVSTKMDIFMMTKESTVLLHEVFMQKDNGTYYIICVSKNGTLKEFNDMLMNYKRSKVDNELLLRLNEHLLDTNVNLIVSNHHLSKENEDLYKMNMTLQENVFSNNQLVSVGKIAASIAHEIRNPLTSVRGFLQLLRPSLIELNKGLYVDIAISELDRANQIIYEFLNVSKPSDHSNLEKQYVSLSHTLMEVIMITESDLLMNNITLNYEPSTKPFFIQGNAKQIKQVLLNIIKNAIEAIQEVEQKSDGIISIELIEENNFTYIIIADNGPGIPETIKSQLFVPFFTTKVDGTGIGLSVSSKIIEEHNGKICLESELGKGTTFFIKFPQIIKKKNVI